MSKHCPTCGSVVDEIATTCSVCGEDLAATNEDTTARQSATPIEAVPIAAAIAGEPEVASNASKVVCTECGSANPRGSTECSTCGAPLERAARRSGRAATSAAKPESKGMLQTYLIAGLAMAVIALVIYIVSTPEEKTGPPQAAMPPGADGANAQGALPPNHPPVDQSAQMEAMNKLVTDLEAKIKAAPESDSLRLALANALYDVGRHPEAVQHYSEYIAKHPKDYDALTDFATSVAAAGNVDSAVVVLNTVLAADPKHQRAAFNMAIMYRQKENRDSITYWLQRVADIDSTSPTGKGALDILQEFKTGHPPM